MVNKIGVVGLGYVGLPVAISMSEVFQVVGFDINLKRVQSLKNGEDHTGEIPTEALNNSNIEFTVDPTKLGHCEMIIVAVPTPIDDARMPDLTPVIKATETVGKHLSKGTIVVYESTVYPGVTEEVCMPILEKASGLSAGEDFFLGYSPERINPGDKEHTFKKITKVVSGQNEYALNIVADVYGKVVDAGVYKASSIKVAEAAKVIENTQRDLNIALMNELAIIFDKLNIDTAEVLEAARTKWNFLPFTPGLVGGHCIGVDPYYLTYKAESIGYHPQVILSGRRINDSMGKYIATALVKKMILNGTSIQGSTVTILGVTFKENVPDIRNSKVIDIINELKEFDIQVQVSDVLADNKEVFEEYGFDLTKLEELKPADAVVIAVGHSEYKQKGWNMVKKLLKDERGIVFDVKNMLNRNECPNEISLWRL